MPFALILPLLLRLAGPLSFTLAAMTAGAMNRSIMIVPLLALMSVLTHVLIARLAPSPAQGLQSLLQPDAVPGRPHPFKGAGQRLAFGLLGYGFAFGLAALVAALFQITEFEPQLQTADLAYVLVPALIGLLGAWASTHLGLGQMAGMMGDMQSMFASMQDNAAQSDPDEEAFTIDGEIIEDEPHS